MGHMHWYGLFVLVWLGLPVFGVWPIVINNTEHTRNNLAVVMMKPATFYEVRGSSYKAVLAQERVEWWLKWAVALTLAAPVAWLLRDMEPLSVRIALTALAALVAYMWAVPFKKQLEYIGHAVEVVAAVRQGFHEPEYVAREASTMINAKDYGGAFKNQVDVVAGLRARYGIAKVLMAVVVRG